MRVNLFHSETKKRAQQLSDNALRTPIMVEDNYMASHTQTENDPTNTLSDWFSVLMRKSHHDAKLQTKKVHMKAVAVKTPPYMSFDIINTVLPGKMR